jgi:hypothetical protein
MQPMTCLPWSETLQHRGLFRQYPNSDSGVLKRRTPIYFRKLVTTLKPGERTICGIVPPAQIFHDLGVVGVASTPRELAIWSRYRTRRYRTRAVTRRVYDRGGDRRCSPALIAPSRQRDQPGRGVARCSSHAEIQDSGYSATFVRKVQRKTAEPSVRSRSSSVSSKCS